MVEYAQFLSRHDSAAESKPFQHYHHSGNLYAPTSKYDDTEVDEFYRELQSLVDQTPKQEILVVQGDWNAEVGEDAQEDWKCGSVWTFLQSGDQ